MAYAIRVDTGGTFTDCLGRDGAGNRVMVKILSSGRLRVEVREILDETAVRLVLPENWRVGDGFFRGFTLENHAGDRTEVADFDLGEGVCRLKEGIGVAGWVDLFTGEEAPILGARLLTGTGLADAFPPLDFRLATTRGTNALLERKGAPVALFIDRGLGDLLSIGDQRRPELFALKHRKREPVHRETVEVDVEMSPSGEIIRGLDRGDAALDEAVSALLGKGIRIAAVALRHSYRNPVPEQQLRDYLLERGMEHVSLSSELAPLIKILPRAQTAVVNAYLQPVLEEFLHHIRDTAGEGNRIFTMTSSGGLEPVEVYRPKDSLLSGPAGGVAGAASIARDLDVAKVITFDMGGTSTDVARYDGDFIYQFEQRVGDVELLATALKIETVASGGGSICEWTPMGLRVGPESAGADPGPACYGRGGPLTVTDVNLLLGRIDRSNFGIPMTDEQVEAAEREALLLQEKAGVPGREPDAGFLRGLLDIAVEQMADAIRGISIRDGADPAEYALLAFGGAGPLHACAIADRLGIGKIIVPGEAGILSAYGLDRSAVERIAEVQVNRPLSDFTGLDAALGAVTEKARSMLEEAGFALDRLRLLAEIRLSGQDSTLTLEVRDAGELGDEFAEEYEKTFGYRPPPDLGREVVSLRAVASSASSGRGEAVPLEESGGEKSGEEGRDFIDRAHLRSGEERRGPCTIQDPFSTLHVPESWKVLVHPGGALLVEKTEVTEPEVSSPAQEGASGEVKKELFRHRFDYVVTEMGTMLRRSAISTNVKERLDFSCALLDHSGVLVASAPHIPVHLGAMGECVRSILRSKAFRPGDAVITNHPGFGGSHLPDVTVISPVFAEGERDHPVAYLANRAHHAEIGGISPGSMPPHARSLAEEGVVIEPRHLVENGESRFAEIESLLRSSRYPSRRVRDNLADLHAQVAANRRGVTLMESLFAEHGAEEVAAQLHHQISRSSDALRDHLEGNPVATAAAEQRLDDGSVIRIGVTMEGGTLGFDFAGTERSHPGNLNATPAIVRSAVLYVLRLWTQTQLPLNEGLLEHVRIHLPECFLNPVFDRDPERCPAVVGGNVETSQRIVDTLLQCLGIQACSQGTMNNLIFGDDSFGYYETIAGGAGAGPGYDGASALHTHMTNTAITDPEILESRYPVRLDEFSIRRNSGGAGKWNGGDGVVRELTFLGPVRVSLLTQHRKEAPFGLEGGGPGKCGAQFVDGVPVEGISTHELEAGQVLRIETPGGGGFG